jgi:hypothetical protein
MSRIEMMAKIDEYCDAHRCTRCPLDETPKGCLITIETDDATIEDMYNKVIEAENAPITYEESLKDIVDSFCQSMATCDICPLAPYYCVDDEMEPTVDEDGDYDDNQVGLKELVNIIERYEKNLNKK